MLEGLLQGGEADPAFRTGRDLQHLATQDFQCQQGSVIGGGLDGHRIPWSGDGTQCQVNGFHATVGDDDVVLGYRVGVMEAAPRQLQGEALMPLWMARSEERRVGKEGRSRW